jgi:hypothetical protein
MEVMVMGRRRHLIVLVGLLLSSPVWADLPATTRFDCRITQTPDGQVTAFTCEAPTPGGDDRPLIVVTNLDDRGPGSLREALSAGGRRVEFLPTLQGTIHLKSHLYARGDDLSLDCRTGGGSITINGQGKYALMSQGKVSIAGCRFQR